MKKRVLEFISLLLLTTYVSATTLQIPQGWNLMGAIEDINSTSLSSSNCELVWQYHGDSNWSLYQSYSTVNNNYDYSQINNIPQGEGFWVYTSSGCTITSISTQ